MKTFVSHIQRGAVGDGPGIRTTVYIKGCPLRCPWCFNAESLGFGQELRFVPQFCIGLENCGKCLTVCKNHVMRPDMAEAKPVLMREDCNLCGECAQICPSCALSISGESIEPKHVVETAMLDAIFHDLSSGGLTLSGGEPLVKPAFAAQTLSVAKSRGLDTAIETCGWFDLDNPDSRIALQNCNTLIFDLKHLDSKMHRDILGLDNARILENFRRICREFPDLKIWVRTTVARGFNDDPAAIRSMAFYVASFPNVMRHELLPCLDIGWEKYAHLGHPLPRKGFEPDSRRFSELVEIVRQCREYARNGNIGERSKIRRRVRQ